MLKTIILAILVLLTGCEKIEEQHARRLACEAKGGYFSVSAIDGEHCLKKVQ